MANPEHLKILRQGAELWNRWRGKHWNEGVGRWEVLPELSGAKLQGADLLEYNLAGTNLGGADLTGADLRDANLRGANLHRTAFFQAKLHEASLYEANLSYADLREADLRAANLSGAYLAEADLSGADLTRAVMVESVLFNSNLSKAALTSACLHRAILVGTDLREATLTGAEVHGASVWDVETDAATQQTGLIITTHDEPAVMVDDLEVAQFIYLLLNREKIRNVIDTVTQKGVLILGRFREGGLDLLQAIAAWLRNPENGGYLPLLFDFPRPESKTYTETVRTLAGLARFVLVDLSGPSVPQEITATVDLHEIPFVPILEQNREDWSMFRDFLVKDRVLEPIRFADKDHLLGLLAKQVIAPAEKLIENRQKRLDKIFGRA